MYCEVKGKRINHSLEEILKRLRAETDNWYFDAIESAGDRLKITCPNHKNGKERHPSCFIYNRDDDDDVEFGTCHCFTCGYVARLPKLVSDVLNISIDDAENWLIEDFADIVVESTKILPPIEINNVTECTRIDESELLKYQEYNDYMWKRKLSKEVVDFFHIGYNKEHNSIMFPVWDEHGNLVMFTERYIDTKRFDIPSNVTKPVYLLNFIKKYGYNKVIVCEGQIDALVSWTYGFPAVALFGSGTTKHQISLLNESGIREFILMYDNDYAGRKGAERFKKNIRNDVFVSDIIMPEGKDVADCSYDEFTSLLENRNKNNCICC